MSNLIINVTSVDERVAANQRKYWTVKTDSGRSWNVFDPRFKECAGTTIEVSVKQNGKFENIELVRMNATPVAVASDEKPTVAIPVFNTFKRDVEKIKGTSMSYAKDVVIALINNSTVKDQADSIKTLDFFYRFFKDTLMEKDEEKTEEALLEEL